MTKITISILTIFGFNLIFTQVSDQDWKLYPGSNDSIHINSDSLSTAKIDTVKEIKIADAPGKVKINKDSRIDKLSKELGTPNDGVSVKIHGYRLQLVASSNKTAIDGERAKFVGMRNDVPTYMDYRQPNFRLRAGNFRTKLEAQKLQWELKDIFPSAIVVNDMIELPKIKKKLNSEEN